MAVDAMPARLGRYEILGSLARGGMAELYLARLPGAEGFAKQVAIKRVLPELARERELVEMFVAEARIAATLDHQNIVHVHDIGHDDNGYFLVMELLHGADVGSLAATVTRFGGRLPIAIALEIARAAAAGLHYAHERRSLAGDPLGLVHRDVSPQNLFVTFDGAIKVLDFGIAKAVQQLPASRTKSGALRGKVPYMSPEQCNAQPLDRRTDVFSLGVVLWEMTVGERLYGADDESELATLKAIVESDAPRPSTRVPDYPPELERVVMTALARDRDARYPTADALEVELEALARAKSWWTSPRELAAFMTTAFPESALAWQDSARRGTAPAPRLTVPLPSESTNAPAALGTAPARSVTQPTPGPIPRSRRLAILGIVLAVAAIAGGIGYVVGHAPSTPAPAKRAGPQPATEDAHWFQPDDVLASKQPYKGERLDTLWVAKPLAPLVPGEPAKLVDGNGNELDTEYYWHTQIATRDELAIGTLAFCQAPSYLYKAKAPPEREHARTQPWMLGRVTDIAHLDAGSVTVANVVCDLAGVRVVAKP